MADDSNPSPSPKAKQKSGRSWLRDLGFFGAGVVVGSAGTIGVGLMTDKIRPEDVGINKDSALGGALSKAPPAK